MNILLISQCDKRALKETRRILDQFAERRGDRTWQTAITQAGLDTLRKLLRKSARRNTAVACHWIRGRDHSELMWIVGDGSRFNLQGATPTNSTERDMLRQDDENDWHCGEAIYLLSALAALMHDLGKACHAFQQRLQGQLTERNRYRHEWISLRLFLAFVGQDSDEQWLNRLLTPGTEDDQRWLANLQRDGLDANCRKPFEHLPPLATAIGWLVLSHHRLPAHPAFDDKHQQCWLGAKPDGLNSAGLQQLLQNIDARWNEVVSDSTASELAAYWQFDHPLPALTPLWRKRAARLAQRLLRCQQRGDGAVWLNSPYIMHLSRLTLMLADHYYSSLSVIPPSPNAPAGLTTVKHPQRVSGEKDYPLFANTLRKTGGMNQPLDEHLLGVCAHASLVSHALPGVERQLPRLARHRGLRRRSDSLQFRWQDKAADMASALRERSRQQGLFVVNMASTGCGKTLANGRIAYALADPQQGARFTIALGLRTLTLQTGNALRDRLHLQDDELAVLVGGSAHRELQEHYQQLAEQSGSASAASLLEEDNHLRFDGNSDSHPLLSRLMLEGRSRQLLEAPILVCTIDHLMPATESLRGGGQILPMLRLLSSDLILDEPDDFDLADSHALTRLVYWCGLLGSRLLLSSATLPPALIQGLFDAYRQGREEYQQQRGQPGLPVDICCAWVDEHQCLAADCATASVFEQAHLGFARQRYQRLAQQEARRLSQLLAMPAPTLRPEEIGPALAPLLLEAMRSLHLSHAEADPRSSKQVSFGLIRMANIEPLIEVALALFQQALPPDWRLHLCVYHAQFPLFLRSAIEHRLDQALNRRTPAAVFELADIRQRLDSSPETHQLFVVLGSPVTEVGRDHDYDWAIAEPSSMRSLIQLAGRIRRHRPGSCKTANLLILDTNIKHLRDPAQAAFCHPGYETPSTRLNSHRLAEILTLEQYHSIDARPRLLERAPLQPRSNLVDLEHQRTRDTLVMPSAPAAAPAGRRSPRTGATAQWIPPLGAYSCWSIPHISLTAVLPQCFPFREDSQRYQELVFLPDDEEEALLCHEVDRSDRLNPNYLLIDGSQLHYYGTELFSSPWGDTDLLAALTGLAESLEISLSQCAKRFATIRLPANQNGWHFHPVLGFRKRR
ncbi:CRISPR-associated protein Cas3 [Pokkaliibacter plantistimulans]|uniref:CRISPR-associated protein Cas3 n=1 Tax=Pokkaliibacter plantistimulans TaxID=1635171 RepID=A0ABX5LTS0_9GAMM|nr:type I-F CRISPR-associated helicase Cas3f [Pokkaliibacter plantistimulans]PXF28893.1 CRISPR-associated protein Cas3 [Pokkaliibacter plantistimulans]